MGILGVGGDAAVAGSMDISSILTRIAGGGALMAIVGIVKGMLNKKENDLSSIFFIYINRHLYAGFVLLSPLSFYIVYLIKKLFYNNCIILFFYFITPVENFNFSIPVCFTTFI